MGFLFLFLDGRKEGPVNHGNTAADTLLEVSEADPLNPGSIIRFWSDRSMVTPKNREKLQPCSFAVVTIVTCIQAMS